MTTSRGNWPLERPRHRQEVLLERVLKIEWEGVEWMHLAVLNMVMNLRIP
jgi:hypothetical protein